MRPLKNPSCNASPAVLAHWTRLKRSSARAGHLLLLRRTPKSAMVRWCTYFCRSMRNAICYVPVCAVLARLKGTGFNSQAIQGTAGRADRAAKVFFASRRAFTQQRLQAARGTTPPMLLTVCHLTMFCTFVIVCAFFPVCFILVLRVHLSFHSFDGVFCILTQNWRARAGAKLRSRRSGLATHAASQRSSS